MGRGDLLVGVLDQMQVLDQEGAPARPVGEQLRDLVRGDRVHPAALRRRLRPLPGRSRVLERANLDLMIHGSVSSVQVQGKAPARSKSLVCMIFSGTRFHVSSCALALTLASGMPDAKKN